MSSFTVHRHSHDQFVVECVTCWARPARHPYTVSARAVAQFVNDHRCPVAADDDEPRRDA